MNKKVYMTLLGSDNYLIGTLALIQSLKDVRSKYPIVVVVTSNVSSKSLKILKKKNIDFVQVGKINISNKVIEDNKKQGYANWSNTFSKLVIFGQTQYKKIVFLDSDMLILKNLDALFDRKNLSAVIAGKSYPGNSDWKDLNSGTMVIVPKSGEDERLLKLVDNNNLSGKFGDQDIIQLGYPNWKNESQLELGEEYNLFAKHEPYYIGNRVLDSPIKVLHFVGKVKPWNMSRKQRYKYCLHVIKENSKVTKSIKGYYCFIRDFRLYCKLCYNIKAEIKN